MNSTSLILAPGNDGKGGGCIPNEISSILYTLLPPNQNIFYGTVLENGTYNPLAWKRCCKDELVSLAASCYPCCEIPNRTMIDTGGDNNTVALAMLRCIGINGGLSGIKLSSIKHSNGNKVKFGLGYLLVVMLAVVIIVTY